jgi:hypothetical protein
VAGLLAPKNTPANIVDKHQAVKEVLADDEVKRYMAQASLEPVGSTPAEFGIFFRAEKDQWAKVIRETGRKLTRPSTATGGADLKAAARTSRLWRPTRARRRRRALGAKGPVRLFLWEKFVDSPQDKPLLLFVHGSSMASQPTFDLTCSRPP